MEESILNTIKSMLGPDSSYEVFDQEILVHRKVVCSDMENCWCWHREIFGKFARGCNSLREEAGKL